MSLRESMRGCHRVLLRSVAVQEHIAGRGLGTQLLKAALARAESLGLRELYLLITTAAEGLPPPNGIGRSTLAPWMQSFGAAGAWRGGKTQPVQ